MTNDATDTGKIHKRVDTGTLGKALDVIEIIANADRALRFSEILAYSNQPRGTLHRQLSNLLAEDLVTLNADQTYAIGIRLLKFASHAWTTNDLRQAAARGLAWLFEQTGETTHLAMLRDTEVIYLDKIESRQSVRMHSQIGNASPAYCTGVGKAALSCLDEQSLEALLTRFAFKRFTDYTLPDATALKDELTQIRTSGVAFDRQEHELGIRCIAAPIVPLDRSFIGGLSITGPAYRVEEEKLATWQPLVREAARLIVEDIETLLGPRRDTG